MSTSIFHFSLSHQFFHNCNLISVQIISFAVHSKFAEFSFYLHFMTCYIFCDRVCNRVSHIYYRLLLKLDLANWKSLKVKQTIPTRLWEEQQVGFKLLTLQLCRQQHYPVILLPSAFSHHDCGMFPFCWPWWVCVHCGHCCKPKITPWLLGILPFPHSQVVYLISFHMQNYNICTRPLWSPRPHLVKACCPKESLLMQLWQGGHLSKARVNHHTSDWSLNGFSKPTARWCSFLHLFFELRC